MGAEEGSIVLALANRVMMFVNALRIDRARTAIQVIAPIVHSSRESLFRFVGSRCEQTQLFGLATFQLVL